MKPDVAEMSGQLSLAAERLLVTDRPACVGTPVLQHTLLFRHFVAWFDGRKVIWGTGTCTPLYLRKVGLFT